MCRQAQRQQPMPKLFSFNTGFIFSIERETGIEPATPSLARRCSTTEPLAHNTNIKFAVAYKLAPTNISISDFNFCVNLFLQISCNFSATFVTNAPPIIKSAFAFIIKNHQKNRPPCESGKIISPFTQRSLFFISYFLFCLTLFRCNYQTKASKCCQ